MFLFLIAHSNLPILIAVYPHKQLLKVKRDLHIFEITKLIKPQVEMKEGTRFETFEALSYTCKDMWSPNGNEMIMDIWIKVLYDEGVMHVKVQDVLYQEGGMKTSLIQYETDKWALEPLPSP